MRSHLAILVTTFHFPGKVLVLPEPPHQSLGPHAEQNLGILSECPLPNELQIYVDDMVRMVMVP